MYGKAAVGPVPTNRRYKKMAATQVGAQHAAPLRKKIKSPPEDSERARMLKACVWRFSGADDLRRCCVTRHHCYANHRHHWSYRRGIHRRRSCLHRDSCLLRCSSRHCAIRHHHNYRAGRYSFHRHRSCGSAQSRNATAPGSCGPARNRSAAKNYCAVSKRAAARSRDFRRTANCRAAAAHKNARCWKNSADCCCSSARRAAKACSRRADRHFLPTADDRSSRAPSSGPAHLLTDWSRSPAADHSLCAASSEPAQAGWNCQTLAARARGRLRCLALPSCASCFPAAPRNCPALDYSSRVLNFALPTAAGLAQVRVAARSCWNCVAHWNCLAHWRSVRLSC